ncbi:MAG: dTMP kinase [Alphaproteobacteria bacterium]|nr:dTMP kinase [Alphaproteobacteria bacterium]
MTAKGLFISFEGGEGAGKTTQIKRLKEWLESQGHDVVLTREPGGTPEAEKIRDLLVKRDGGNWDGLTELLLFFAARRHHVETLIKPAIAEGKIVICDRFADSTEAYQCYGHGVSKDVFTQIKTIVLGDFAPDTTFLLDVPVDIGLKRSKRVNDSTEVLSDAEIEDRFERLDATFHEKLRAGFLEIAAQNDDRFMVIDALKPLDDITAEIQQTVEGKLANV